MTSNHHLLYHLTERMLEQEKHMLLVDDLFDDQQIGDYIKSIQIDSPYQQMIFEGVLTESINEEKLYVNFTVEGYFHYVLGNLLYDLSKEYESEYFVSLVTSNNLIGLKEGIQYCLIKDILNNNIQRLINLISNPSFPIEICILPLANYFILSEKEDNQTIALESRLDIVFNLLLKNNTQRDFEIIRYVVKYLKHVKNELVNKLYEKVIKIDQHKSHDNFRLLLSEAMVHLPIEYLKNLNIENLVSDSKEILFELNIDKIRLQRKLNQHNLAEEFIRHNLKILDQNTSQIRADKISLFYDSLSFYYSDLGEYVKAKNASIQALSYITKTKLEYGVSLNNLALICIDLGEFEIAERYLKEAFEFDSNIFGKYSENSASRLGNLGYLYLIKGEYEKSLVNLELALNIDQRIFGKFHENVATRLLNISDCKRRLNRNDEAIITLHKSREIDIYNYGVDHPILAGSYNIEAHILLNQKKISEAHNIIDIAIAINKRLNGGINDQLNRDYNFKGILYSKQGDYKNALETFIKANKIEQKLFSELPQHRIITWINICKTLKNLGKLNSENQIYKNLLSLPFEFTKDYKTEIQALLNE